MLQITYHGRLGNTLFLCVGASMLARRYDLKVISYNIPVYEYPHTELSEIQKYLGIELFCGNAGYNEWMEITDKNLIQALNGEFKNKAFHINKSKDTYFQIKPFVLEYKQEIRDHFKNLKYDNYVSKDDVLLHLRLGDKANSIGRDVPDLKYYHECFNKITFKNGYIMTDTPEHSLVKELIGSYNLRILNGSPAECLAFAKNFNKLILSSGTFSWWIGFLSKAETIYYPIPSKPWHGDIFVYPEWQGINI